MKRFILLFIICSLVMLPARRSHALSGDPSLYIIPAASIGVALLPVSTAVSVAGLVVSAASIAGSTYYASTGESPVYAAASSMASAADTIFIPAFQAFSATFVSPESFPASAGQYVGLEGSVGATTGDIVAAVKAAPTTYPTLSSIVALNSVTYDTLDLSTVSGKVISSYGVNYQLGTVAYVGQILRETFLYNGSGKWIEGYEGYAYISVGKLWIWSWQPGSSGKYLYYNCPLSTTSSTVNYFRPEAQTNYQGLKDALSNPDAQESEELKDVVKNLPDDKKVVSSNPSPSNVPAQDQKAITQEQVNNFFTQNTTNVYNQYNSVANNSQSTYNDIEAAKAAAELAKAQEEEEKKEETFSSIADSPFGEPYSPGEYDIPERFTSFLNTVKSSGLFSFSSSFFNSLPGGGSPVYEIEAGQYGHHSIDLSQTLSIGLAVLKTVLLACFGFLSIRAVIMKR
jgi:hypothetical protein